MICTGMWRVSGLCQSWLSTVQPSMSGRNPPPPTSSRTAVGWYAGKLQRVGAAGGDQHLELLVAGKIDQHAGIMRIVLDDQQNGVAGLEVEAIVGDRLEDALLLRRANPVVADCSAGGWFVQLWRRRSAGRQRRSEYFSGR